jgi:hypothetical protein
MTSIPQNITRLIEIGERAIEAYEMEQKRKAAYETLIAAWQSWKDERGIARVVKNSPEWKQMQESADDEYSDFCLARDVQLNAERRLSAAITRHFRKGGDLADEHP